MNIQDIKRILDKSLGMPIGDVKDEWKAPAVVVGESDGETFVQTRAENSQDIRDLRGKVKESLSGYVLRYGMAEFFPVEFRYLQTFVILKEKTT